MNLNANRNHKDSVFSVLFGTPDVLRELYSAIVGIDIPPDAIVDINTLSDAIYMKRINDLSFTINDRIVVLIEHQSTINENVPVRLLMYIGRVYEKITEEKKLYQKKLVKIPTPEFIVLYNGKDEYPDHQELRLSHAFKDLFGFGLSKGIELPLELIVHVYNINHGRNPEILKRSETLNAYSIFIEKIKEFNEKLELDEAVRSAIKYCIEHNILKDFLERHGSEVVNMLFYDISVEELGEVRYDEGYEDGHVKGCEEGCEEAKLAIARNALAEGYSTESVQKITGLSLEEIEKLG